jgi:hypothetical protein
MSQIRLGDLLVRAQVVSEAQLNAALAEQKQWGGRLGSILVRMGVLNEDLLVKALAKQLNLPRAPLGPTDPLQVPEAVRTRVDRATCERLLMLPIGWVQERRAVVVAVADPLNVVAIDDFSRRIGARVELMIAPETQLMQAIARVFTGAGGVDSRVTGTEEGLSFVDNSTADDAAAAVVGPDGAAPARLDDAADGAAPARVDDAADGAAPGRPRRRRPADPRRAAAQGGARPCRAARRAGRREPRRAAGLARPLTLPAWCESARSRGSMV